MLSLLCSLYPSRCLKTGQFSGMDFHYLCSAAALQSYNKAAEHQPDLHHYYLPNCCKSCTTISWMCHCSLPLHRPHAP